MRREGDLDLVTLTESAAGRLGIRVVRVERRRVELARALGGEAEALPGRRAVLAAPFAAFVAQPEGATRALSAGARVTRGEPLLALRPILAAEARVTLAASRVEAAGDVEAARVSLEAARVAAKRAEELLEARSGSQRDVDETRARVALAEATLRAAERRVALLETIDAPGDGPNDADLGIASPLDGIVTDLHVAFGQAVEAGAPLVSVTDVGALWIRVPVYGGDIPGLDTSGDALVRPLGSPADLPGRVARAVDAPPAASAGSATVDAVFEVDASDGFLRPGQRVEALIPERASGEHLVVPWSAVVFDHDGGSWVYERTAPQTFARRRVRLGRVLGGATPAESIAIVLAGLQPAADVVADGVAELFSTEFGAAK